MLFAGRRAARCMLLQACIKQTDRSSEEARITKRRVAGARRIFRSQELGLGRHNTALSRSTHVAYTIT